MPFDLQAFQNTFDFAAAANPIQMMQFQADPVDENDDVVIYQAVIATQEMNPNYVIPDVKTLQNIAAQCNRESANDDVPIHQMHNSREFQIGVMLTGAYESGMNRTTGTFNISKDPDTETLRTRMRLGIVRDMSPKLKGKVTCNVCDEKMYVYGGCINDHYLGEVIRVEGKDITVTGSFEDADVVEVSVVSRGAFMGGILFSDVKNEQLITEAIKEGVITEKAIHTIAHNYSVDMDRFKCEKPSKSTSLPTHTIGGPPVSKTTDADTQLLKDNVADLEQKIVDRDKQIKTYQDEIKTLKETTIAQTEYSALETDRDAKNARITELESNLPLIGDYEACVNLVRDKAILFYAKIRGVEVTDTKDHLFVQRKKTLDDSKSLPYLIGAYEQYQRDYYTDTTEFGGVATKSQRDAEPVATQVNQKDFDF